MGNLLILAAVVLAVYAVCSVIFWSRRCGCIFREHNTVPLKRIGKYAFIVQCVRCGWLFFKTLDHGQYEYRRYRGQFDDFEDYADEEAEAEPTFVEDEGSNA